MFPHHILHRRSSFHVYIMTCTVIVSQPFFYVKALTPIFSLITEYYLF